MKRIFLIIMTICMVMTTGCGGASSNKRIDYLNLTLEDLKNINWDMTLDEFKESIGDVEFEEDNGNKDAYSLSFSNLKFNKTDSNIYMSKYTFSNEILSEIYWYEVLLPEAKDYDTLYKQCNQLYGNPIQETKDDTVKITVWKTNDTIIFNNGNGTCFTIYKDSGEIL